jgi:hypothetical protein
VKKVSQRVEKVSQTWKALILTRGESKGFFIVKRIIHSASKKDLAIYFGDVGWHVQVPFILLAILLPVICSYHFILPHPKGRSSA